MARTNDGLVKGVLGLGSQGGDYDDVNNPSLTRFITAANLVTTRVNACAGTKGIALSTAELAEIETWLAAHMYVMSRQNVASQNTAGAGGTYQGQTGMGIQASKYGQTALMIDYSGCLLAIAERKMASMGWLGKVPSDQIDIQDRS